MSDETTIPQTLPTDPTPQEATGPLESASAELPVGSDETKTNDETDLGESAPASGDAEVVPPADAPATTEPDVSAGDAAASPEPSADAPIDPTAAPADAPPADEGSAEAIGSPEPALADGATDEPSADAPAAPAGEATDVGAADEAKADAAKTDDVSANAPGEPIIAIAVPDTQPIFGGASNPSPAPDLGGEEELPHPALQGHGPGFIAGATESTQSAIPVPGVAGAALVAAQAIDAAQSADPTAVTQQGDKPEGQGEQTGSTDQLKPEVDGETSTTSASTQPSAVEAPTPATPAVPTAAHAPEAFVDLNQDGSAALDGIDDDEAEVLLLELRGLANLALALVKRLEKVGEKKAVSGHLEGIQASAQQVISGALNMFETEEDDLAGFESASAEIILDDLGSCQGDEG